MNASDLELDPEVAAFLQNAITSFEQLQLLFLLRQRREETFTVSAVANAIHIPEAVGAATLDHLCKMKLLEAQLGSDSYVFRYNPETPALAVIVDKLAEAWTQNSVNIIKLMSANAIQRVRTDALRTFADAFLIGPGQGKKNDG